MTTTEAYHDFLCRKRLFCEHPGCFDRLTKAKVVRNVNGRDTCLCNFHADLETETLATQTELQSMRQAT